MFDIGVGIGCITPSKIFRLQEFILRLPPYRPFFPTTHTHTLCSIKHGGSLVSSFWTVKRNIYSGCCSLGTVWVSREHVILGLDSNWPYRCTSPCTVSKIYFSSHMQSLKMTHLQLAHKCSCTLSFSLTHLWSLLVQIQIYANVNIIMKEVSVLPLSSYFNAKQNATTLA